MRIRRWFPLLIVLGCWTILAPAAEGAQRRGRGRPFTRAFELHVYLTHTEFERDTRIDDDVGTGVRLGYLFTPHHQIEFLVNGVSADDVDFPAFGVDILHLQSAYVYNFTKGGVVPYLTAGFGFMHADDDQLGDESDLLYGLGGGVRLFMGPVVHARFEYRHNRFEGDGTVFADGRTFEFDEIAFGIGWRLPAR